MRGAHDKRNHCAVSNHTGEGNGAYTPEKLDYLFAHESIARISILTDMQEPKPEDNTHRTYRAYLPLVAACRPDWDDKTVRKKTFLLVTIMQQTFLRHKIVSGVIDMDLTQKENRKVLHTRILHEILEG